MTKSKSIPEPRPAKERAFAVTVAFDLMDGSFARFHGLVSRNAQLSVEREAGCLRFDVLVPTSVGPAPQVFLYEIYRDRAAFDLHLASEHYRTFDDSTRELVNRKTVWTFEVDQNAKTSV